MNVHQSIIKGIKELLFLNDYLVIPKFGGFVLKSYASRYTSSNTHILPPSKTVSFNVQLKQNDGVLVNWLQREIASEAETALMHVQEFAEFCLGILNTKRRLTIDSIGLFYLDFENNLCFEPQQDSNFLSSSFGLGPVTLTELVTDTSKAESKPETDFVNRVRPKAEPIATESSEKKTSRPSIRKPLGIAAIALVLFSSLSLLVTQLNVKGVLKSSLVGLAGKSNYQQLNYPEFKLEASLTTKVDYVVNANGLAVLELDKNTSITVKVNDEVMPSRKSGNKAVRHKTGAAFEIVFGCFAVKSNANRFVKTLRKNQIAADISSLNHKGMYVVSYGRFSTKLQALAEIETIKTDYPSAWIKQLP